jgi:hypothetical protein
MNSVLLNYAGKYSLYPAQLSGIPASDLGICVVIPCFNEENITNILQSLFECERPSTSVEVIVVLNAPENASAHVYQRHFQLSQDFNNWKSLHDNERMRFYLLKQESLPKKDAGVGLARKIGMDEAVFRFLQYDNPQGIIANIDADCTCSSNYLVELEKLFQDSNINACSIRFEHPMEGNDYPPEVYHAIVQYELYLHYYMMAFRKTGHPFAFHTIGSSFAVRAGVYCMQGGMNKRKAGEDFYFLQKVIPLGHYAELNTAFVYPSPRASQRVPFGTGASIDKMLKNKEICYFTYDIQAFEDLSILFSKTTDFFHRKNLPEILETIPEPLKTFLLQYDIEKHIEEIHGNTTNIKTFTTRFYKWFNAFIVLKYMNFSHEHFYKKKPIEAMAVDFLRKYEPETVSIPETSKEMLVVFRELMYGKMM